MVLQPDTVSAQLRRLIQQLASHCSHHARMLFHVLQHADQNRDYVDTSVALLCEKRCMLAAG